jgi:hypothetical protein
MGLLECPHDSMRFSLVEDQETLNEPVLQHGKKEGVMV